MYYFVIVRIIVCTLEDQGHVFRLLLPTQAMIGHFRVNPRFHPRNIGRNLALTRKFPTHAQAAITLDDVEAEQLIFPCYLHTLCIILGQNAKITQEIFLSVYGPLS